MKRGLNIAGKIGILIFFLPGVVLVGFPGRSAWGSGLAGVGYQLNWDQRNDRKESGVTETWTLKQTLDVKYRGFLNPVIENELTLKVEQERDSEGKDTIRVNPVITLGYKGAYWAMGAKRTVEESNEPDKETKTTDSYFVELFLKPARMTLPDLKAKYNLDQDYQAGSSDVSRHSFIASSVYSPMDWIQLKGDYSQNRSYDYLRADSDTVDTKYSGLAGFRFLVTPKVRFNTEYRSEVASGWTKLDDGGRSSDKKDTDQTWKNALSFRPFADTVVDSAYDWESKKIKATGEDTTTSNFKVTAAQRFLVADLKADYAHNVTEVLGSADDNRKTENTWTFDAGLKFSRLLTFVLKYQDKETDEVHFLDPTKDTTTGSKIYSGSWVGDLTEFWKASAAYDQTDSYTKGIKTAIDKKYSIKSTFAFKMINLILDPTYDVTFKEDLVKVPPEETKTKDFRTRLSWMVFSTMNMTGKIDHTYGRKTDSLANNIQRTDDTAANVTWMAPIPGWNLSFDVTRTATDTSGDDLPADVNSSAGFRADFRKNELAFSTNYKYDIKTRPNYDTETFDAKIGWLAPRWETTLTYTFNKTFSPTLDEVYTIALAFKLIIN